MPFTGELAARAESIEAVAAAREAAESAGIDELFLVGGAVRDLLRGTEPVDIDLAVNGDPQALAVALTSPASATAERPAGQETRFGTVTVLRDGVRYDIARTRTERYSHGGALPEVAPASIEQDLLRRDFTVNAIAFGLLGQRAGEVLAAPDALEDLTARRLAVLHDASFTDDPTRLLRLGRYRARLSFEIAPPARALAEQAIAAGALQTISGTRVGNELRLLATELDPIAAFISTAEIGLPWKLDAELARSALDALPSEGRRDRVVLAAVFTPGDDDGAEASAVRPDPHSQHQYLVTELDRLGFTAADRDTIVEAATVASSLAQRLSNAGSRTEIARAVGQAAIETVALASALGAADQAQLWLQDLRHLRLEITGADLIRRGVAQGPTVGTALAAARDALIDGHAADRESQLAIALKAAQ